MLYSQAEATLAAFAERARHSGRRDAGRQGRRRLRLPLGMGSVGVTGTGAANAMAEEADLVLAVGTRLQDFTTGSWALFKGDRRKILGAQHPALRCRKAPRPAPRRRRQGRPGASRRRRSARWTAPAAWTKKAKDAKADWQKTAARYTGPTNAELPSDAQVIGAVQRVGERPTSSSAPPAACRASCTSCGTPARRAATTWNTAIPAWATRSPAVSASRWPIRRARSSSCSATAPI